MPYFKPSLSVTAPQVIDCKNRARIILNQWPCTKNNERSKKCVVKQATFFLLVDSVGRLRFDVSFRFFFNTTCYMRKRFPHINYCLLLNKYEYIVIFCVRNILKLQNRSQKINSATHY
jgi:hypothetical protein